MWSNQREFLNGVVRKFKPKKIVEIGVSKGGGSCIILNAIQDIKNAHLYSIDLSNGTYIGKCVKYLFNGLYSKEMLQQNSWNKLEMILIWYLLILLI